jgi:hypothetical protein
MHATLQGISAFHMMDLALQS